MTQAKCSTVGCSHAIVGRCRQCNRNFCLQHMALGAVECDGCITTRKKAGALLMKRGGAMILWAVGLIAIGAVTTFFLRVLIIISDLGVILFFIGIVIVLAGLIRKYWVR
jgi:hypothetical protein